MEIIAVWNAIKGVLAVWILIHVLNAVYCILEKFNSEIPLIYVPVIKIFHKWTHQIQNLFVLVIYKLEFKNILKIKFF
jgi:bifunctional DNase/RNase